MTLSVISVSASKRPRNINAFQAAAILYGDWGTSKAYVLGLAFALAGYSSFWLILAVSSLIALVGINYITICKFSPTGGGVYASARKRSEVLSLMGAFFLIADYLITAALSAVSCFEYMGVINPSYWAIGAILLIGVLNFLGPKHSGNVAFALAIPTVATVILLALAGIPFLGSAVQHLEPLHGGFFVNWNHFVGIIVALSGIEAIANTTGVMKLDPGSTDANPSVHQTSKKAILWVMIEVSFFTSFLGLLMMGLPGLQLEHGDVFSPEGTSIRDAMLRYMAHIFASYNLSPEIGELFGMIVSLVFGVLLLSAVNTAIVALISLLFVMSRDGELSPGFQNLNRFGVPIYPLILSSLAPALILLFVNNVPSLAELYAVGFVGAIATNLGTNGFDHELPLKKSERYLMLLTFVIMVFIEISLFIDKPNARRFALTILSVGLILRAFVVERRQKQWASKKVKLKHASLYNDDELIPLHEGAMLCAISTIGKTLDFALQEAKRYNQPLYILFVREQKVIMEEDRNRIWLDDEDACRIFDYAKESSHEMTLKFFYSVSDSPAYSIVEMAKDLKVSRVILGRTRLSPMLQIIRGNIVQEVSEILPPDIDLLVIS